MDLVIPCHMSRRCLGSEILYPICISKFIHFLCRTHSIADIKYRDVVAYNNNYREPLVATGCIMDNSRTSSNIFLSQCAAFKKEIVAMDQGGSHSAKLLNTYKLLYFIGRLGWASAHEFLEKFLNGVV